MFIITRSSHVKLNTLNSQIHVAIKYLESKIEEISKSIRICKTCNAVSSLSILTKNTDLQYKQLTPGLTTPEEFENATITDHFGFVF